MRKDQSSTQNHSPLILARQKFAEYSIRSAFLRIQLQKQFNQKYNALQIEDLYDEQVLPYCSYESLAIEYGDNSSITRGRFSEDGKFYCTVGASGQGIIWSTSSPYQSQSFCQQQTRLVSVQKLHDISFHPKVGQIPEHAPNLITSSNNGSINLWTLSSQLKQQKSLTIQAHEDRVNRVLFDKSGNYFFTSSYDKTWALWDFKKVSQVFVQKGHQKEIHASGIHPDNSLFFTGDLSGAGMIWDLRSGKGIFQIIEPSSILCCDFNPSGYQLAIGGKTNIITIKDLRQRKTSRQIPAHLKLISDLKYSQNGNVLASGSHDNTVKVWHGLHYGLLNQDLIQESKISSIDLRNDLLAATTIDRRFVLWGKKTKNAKFEEYNSQINSQKQPN